MGCIGHSLVSLRIFGDALRPVEITRMLGCEPTQAEYKDEEIHGRSTGRVRIARTGSWRLQAERREPEDLNGQIEEILGKLTADLDVWAGIGQRYRVDLFCELFMATSNDGMSLAPASLLALGQRGIELALDIYDAGDNR